MMLPPHVHPLMPTRCGDNPFDQTIHPTPSTRLLPAPKRYTASSWSSPGRDLRIANPFFGLPSGFRRAPPQLRACSFPRVFVPFPIVRWLEPLSQSLSRSHCREAPAIPVSACRISCSVTGLARLSSANLAVFRSCDLQVVYEETQSLPHQALAVRPRRLCCPPLARRAPKQHARLPRRSYRRPDRTEALRRFMEGQGPPVRRNRRQSPREAHLPLANLESRKNHRLPGWGADEPVPSRFGSCSHLPPRRSHRLDRRLPRQRLSGTAARHSRRHPETDGRRRLDRQGRSRGNLGRPASRRNPQPPQAHVRFPE